LPTTFGRPSAAWSALGRFDLFLPRIMTSGELTDPIERLLQLPVVVCI
jgi:hypothetical protein